MELAAGDETIDLVGFGVTDRYEGERATTTDAFESLSRTDGVDTDDNADDFSSQEPTPQHSVVEVEGGGAGKASLTGLSSDLSSTLSSGSAALSSTLTSLF